MSFTLVLNSSNVSNTSTNTTFKYNFIQGGFQVKDMEMCVSSITLPYSFYNVSSYYANRTFSLIFPTAATTTNFYDGTAITSSTFRWQGGNDNINYLNDTFVSYCFAEVAGYSAFGSYTGNGSTDGPFIFTGFRPAFLLVKRSNASVNWYMFDNKRNTYNAVNLQLSPNLSNAESSDFAIDFLSNGFKLRIADSFVNGSGDPNIYMAFAEAPFKNSLAR